MLACPPLPEGLKQPKPIPAGLRELTLGVRDVLGDHGAHASVRGLAQDLAALGRLTLLLAPPNVAAALPSALGGLVELRVHEEELDFRRWWWNERGKTWACPDYGGSVSLHGAACPDVGASCHHTDEFEVQSFQRLRAQAGEI